MFVKFASNSAGPFTNDTPTASNRNPVNIVINRRTPVPRYFPTMSGRLMPSLRTESMPEK